MRKSCQGWELSWQLAFWMQVWSVAHAVPACVSPVVTTGSATVATDSFQLLLERLACCPEIKALQGKTIFCHVTQYLHGVPASPCHQHQVRLTVQSSQQHGQSPAALCASFAGGRNVTVGLRSHSGYFRRTSVVALAIFSQYWYWYPLSYFLTLTLQPTALLGLNSDLQMPKLQVSLLSASFVRPACMHPSQTVLHDCTFGQEA